MGTRNRRPGFTLIELLVVTLIIAIVSVVALPAVVSSLSHRQISEAARLLQGAIVGARDVAIHNNRPSGIRLLPDPIYNGINPSTGLLDPSQILACNRIIPIDAAPDYSEGAVSIYPGTAYPAGVMTVNGFTGVPALVLEEAGFDSAGLPLPPNSWAWNIRIGDRVQIGNAGPWYTVVGPSIIFNPEQFVNFGKPETPSGIIRQTVNGAKYNPEYLLLVNGQDDNQNAYADDGYDGYDNNGDGSVDELAEWELEAWLGSLKKGCTAKPYTIARRPMPSSNAREVALPSNVVVDLTGWGLDNPERSRPAIALNWSTGSVDILMNPDGTLVPSTVYSSPTSFGTSNVIHLWLSERADLIAPSASATAAPYLPIGKITDEYNVSQTPYSGPRITGEYAIVSITARSGIIKTASATEWDNPNLPIIQFYPVAPFDPSVDIQTPPPPIVYDPSYPFYTLWRLDR